MVNCIACDRELPVKTGPGRKPIICPGDRECQRTYMALYWIRKQESGQTYYQRMKRGEEPKWRRKTVSR